MSDLTIRWAGGEKSFSPGTNVRIGRDPGGEVVVDNPNVSRIHVLVAHDGSSWVMRDHGSFQGTFRDGHAVSEMVLGPAQTVSLGAPPVGVNIEMTVGEATAPTRARDAATDGLETVLPVRETRPGGALRDDIFDSATVVGGHSLRVECAGKTYQFSPGKRVTVGRDAEADVVSTNPTVSRNHAVITHDGEGWTIEDQSSAAGIYVDGRRIKTARISGSTAVWLGDPETGERVVFVASGQREPTSADRVRRLSRSGHLGIAAAVLAILAVGVAVFALNAGEPETLDRNQLAKGVVRIETSEGSLGSGTVVDAELGLILTSAHVVAPRALGQGVARDLVASELSDDPRTITIWVSDGLDQTAEPRFRGEVVAADGYLDLAIVRITETVGGALIEDGDLAGLVPIPIGDASTVESGDQIQILGYPTVAQSNAATLTSGVLAGPVQDTRLGSNRAFINLDAEIRPGNSGGLVADAQGRIIGVPTLNWIENSEDIGSMRPIGFAKALIDAARADKEYVSRHVTPLTGDEEFPSALYGFTSDSGFRQGCNAVLDEASTGDRRISLQIDYSGFAPGKHQDVALGVFESASGELIGFTSTAYDWPVEFDESGCVTTTVDLDRPLAEGTYFIDFFVGPNYEFDPGQSLSFGI